MFGDSDDPQNPGNEQPGDTPGTENPGTEPTVPEEPQQPGTTPGEPAEPDIAGNGNLFNLGGLLDLFT